MERDRSGDAAGECVYRVRQPRDARASAPRRGRARSRRHERDRFDGDHVCARARRYAGCDGGNFGETSRGAALRGRRRDRLPHRRLRRGGARVHARARRRRRARHRRRPVHRAGPRSTGARRARRLPLHRAGQPGRSRLARAVRQARRHHGVELAAANGGAKSRHRAQARAADLAAAAEARSDRPARGFGLSRSRPRPTRTLEWNRARTPERSCSSPSGKCLGPATWGRWP